jgi:hypothetical protein
MNLQIKNNLQIATNSKQKNKYYLPRGHEDQARLLRHFA